MAYQDTFDELKQRFEIISQETVNTNEQIQSQVNELSELTNDLLFLKREVEAVLQENYDMAAIINKRLNNMSNDTEKLRSQVTNLKDKDAGSIQMYKDIQTRYNQRFVGNIIIASLASYVGYLAFSKMSN